MKTNNRRSREKHGGNEVNKLNELPKQTIHLFMLRHSNRHSETDLLLKFLRKFTIINEKTCADWALAL